MKLKIVKPIKTIVTVAYEQLRVSSPDFLKTLTHLNIYERRKLRALALQNGLKNELLKVLYKE